MVNTIITITIGADHRGVQLKSALISSVVLSHIDLEWIDIGCFEEDYCDYPLYAQQVAEAIRSGKATYGILICSTGVGMAMAANRFASIYAALAWNEAVAQLSREHDNSNVLVLPSDFVTIEPAIVMTTSWLMATFQKGRYQKRIKILDSLGGA